MPITNLIMNLLFKQVQMTIIKCHVKIHNHTQNLRVCIVIYAYLRWSWPGSFYRSVCKFTLAVFPVTIRLSLLSVFESRFLATPSNFLLQMYFPKKMNNWAYQMQWQSKPGFTSREYLMYQISVVINLEKINVSGIVLSLSAFVKVIIINSATATVTFSFWFLLKYQLRACTLSHFRCVQLFARL